MAARDKTLQKNADQLRQRYNFDESYVTQAALTAALDELLAETADEPSASIPPGMLFDWLAADIPAGWLAADGSAVSRTIYAALFGVVGTVYGIGDGSSTFNLPDTRGRVTAGYDASQTEFDALGEAGGAKTHTLTVAQIPPLTINLPYWFNAPVAGGEAYQLSGSVYGNTTLTANATGGGAHNNLQPYIVIKKIIKY